MISYRGKNFPGYNKPVKSNKPGKKMTVLAKKDGKTKLIHFGAASMGHNYSEAARKSYLARSGGIKNKAGKSTANDKLSPNYWSRKVLWAGPKGSKKAPPKSQKIKKY
jgi:hypothetical protein